MPRIKKPDPGADPGTGAGGFYQDDFGGFNPRFAGVTIRIASQAAYDEFASFLTSPLPGNREEPLGPILMRSVMEHEIRHYHDFLLGSYNGILFRARLQALLNGMEALHAAKELPGEVFPLPLGTWMALPVEEREARLEEWAAFSSDGKKCTAIPVPSVSREALLQPSETGLYVTEDGDPAAAFALAAEYAARGYARIQAVAQGTRPGTQRRTQTAQAGGTMHSPAHQDLINPANIQEVLALTVQLGAIWQAQGEQQARVFARFFLGDCDLPSARLWRLLLDVSLRWTPGVTGHEDELEKAFAASFQVMAIGTWTLLGSHAREGEAAFPAARLARLISHLLADRAEANIASDVAATWDYWDTALVLNPWRESLTDSLDWTGRGVNFYADVQKASLPGWKKDFHATLHHMMKAYADDQRMLIEHVLEQPEDLVGVSRYLGLPAGILPMPLFRLQLDHSALDLGTLDQKVFEPVMTVDLDGTVAVLSCLLKMSTPMYRERAADAVAFEYAAQLCDMAFSQQAPYGRSPLLQKRLLSDLEKTVRKTLRFIV